MVTIVFLSFHSEKHIRRHILEIGNSYPIIIVDNSRNFEFKNEVYLLNQDTWGIMSTYNELIETIPFMNKFTNIEKKLIITS